jgi:AcrR family transcriptional regulator
MSSAQEKRTTVESRKRPRAVKIGVKQARARVPLRGLKRAGAPRTAGPRRPRGREAVMAAVLDAATVLFAARGPASVSVRDIANAAGVNHALVHRHFGSKHAVLRAVLERAASGIAAAASAITDSRAAAQWLFNITADHESYWRALARAELDGEDPRKLQRDFPTIHKMIELLRTERQPSCSPRSSDPSFAALDSAVVVGSICALTMGWLLFEPLLLAATGLDKRDRKEVRTWIIGMLQMMIENPRDGAAPPTPQS